MNLPLVKIGIDASGGDFGYPVISEGVRKALEKDPPFEIFLYTTEDFQNDSLHLTVMSCANRHEELTHALKDMAQSPMINAVVTATNSQKLLVGVRPHLIDEIKRPALLAPFPTTRGISYLADVGATAKDHDPRLFFNWLRLGYHYLLSIGETPRIGLLNIASERSCKEISSINQLLKGNDGYVGYVEPADFFAGKVNLALCDGFMGNMLLKQTEEFAQVMGKEIIGTLKDLPMAQKAIMKLIKRRYSYDAYLVSPLLGLKNGYVFRVHGKANAEQVSRALELAYEQVK